VGYLQKMGIAGQARNDGIGGDLQGLLLVGISFFALICHRQGFPFFCYKRNTEKPSHNKDLAHG
jgi:hypothetical protein